MLVADLSDLRHGRPKKELPGKPVAYNYELLSINNGLLWSIVASFFGLLGVPGTHGGSGRLSACALACSLTWLHPETVQP